MRKILLILVVVALLVQPALAAAKTGKFVVLSEEKGSQIFNSTALKAQKVERKAVQYSPLAWYMPAKWVPLVASAIGVLMMAVIHPALGIVQSYVESIISSRKKEKLKIKKEALKVMGIKLREVVSIVASAFILGFAISWTYAGPTPELLGLLVINLVVCLFAGISHEVIGALMGRMLGVETEYKFWPSGSVLTLVTAFLGNAFGLQGILVEEIKEGTLKWKVGVMKFVPLVFTTGIMVLFSVLDYLYPHVVLQMIYSIAGMVAMADILPFKPMDGYDIRKWNFFVWSISFVVVFCLFAFVSFVF